MVPFFGLTSSIVRILKKVNPKRNYNGDFRPLGKARGLSWDRGSKDPLLQSGSDIAVEESCGLRKVEA